MQSSVHFQAIISRYKTYILMAIRQFILTALLFVTSYWSFSQGKDSSKMVYHFSGTGSITNNGISLIPSFSLGKPALLILMSLGGKRFSIDPDIRFSLNGKPWVFVFNGRYKMIDKGKFLMVTGANLGLNFKATTLLVNNAPTETIILRRYLGLEMNCNYAIAKNCIIGTYYLYSRGIDNGAVKSTHFITLNGNLSHIPTIKKIYLRINAQLYYLNQEGKDGQFYTATFTLSKSNFPLSVSSIINKTIRTNYPRQQALYLEYEPCL
jgi:hypothetical protein